MAKLFTNSNHLIIVCFDELIAFSNKSCNWEYQKTLKCEGNINKSNEVLIESCAFSPNGKYFGVCHNKSLLIYDTFDWKLLHVFAKERKTSSINFFPESNLILLSYKNGCAVFYSFEDGKLMKNSRTIGHNSMLTGSLVTSDGNFVITCDRDEKIRVTNYPNVYDIERYCLGHFQFISCIDFLPNNSKILISSSGDGNIKFWDFMLGIELTSYNCSNSKINDETNTIIKFTSCQLNKLSVVAVLQYKSKYIKILVVKSNETKIVVDVLCVLNLKKVPWDITFFKNYLICLIPERENPISVWSVTENSVVEDKLTFINIKEYLKSNWNPISNLSSKISDDISVLFKREIDLQEYLQKKKARLIKTAKTT